MPSSGNRQRGHADLLIPMENKILGINTECRILTENGVCLEPVSGCHVISASHLALLDSGQVCAWPHLPYVIGAIYLGERLGKQNPRRSSTTKPGSNLIERFGPKRISIKSDYATVRFACNRHDSPVFDPITHPRKLNPDDPETGFKLGFISLLGATTFVNSFLEYMRDSFPLEPTVIRNARKDPGVRKILQDLQDGLKPLQQMSETLSEHLVRWNQAHLEKDWHKAQTAVVSANSPIHIAGAGFLPLDGKDSNSIATILPQPGLDRCRIFSTTLLEEPLNPRGQDEAASRTLREAQSLKHIIENGDPADWLGAMAKEWPFFYVSSADWNQKLDERQKQAIEIKAAQKFES